MKKLSFFHTPLKPVISRNILADQVGESSKQIQRYIRLTELIPELLDLIDNKKLQFTVAVDISYIDKEVGIKYLIFPFLLAIVCGRKKNLNWNWQPP